MDARLIIIKLGMIIVMAHFINGQTELPKTIMMTSSIIGRKFVN